MPESIDTLTNLKRFAENEKGNAQGRIYELRRQITEIEKEICHFEGERDLADYMISKVEEEIKGLEVK